jgi:hypothetical protein
MAGLLQALPKTKLFKRLMEEHRLLETSSGNNTDIILTFVPKMDPRVLIAGYKRVLRTIYSPEKYYERICNFLEKYRPRKRRSQRMSLGSLLAFARSVWYIGIVGEREERRYYWKTLRTAWTKYRKSFSEAVALQIYGLHLRQIANLISDSEQGSL